ncbi:MAG: hypothetical protein ACFFCH_10570 [Promethearchaeota archaeon]
MCIDINRKRLGIALLTGALLGILCIIGVGARIPGGYLANIIFLIGMWYNRLIMGLVIGFVDEIVIIKGENSRMWVNSIIRGLLFGLIVSAAIFLSTEFRDIPSFFAGIAYGIIIDLVATALT